MSLFSSGENFFKNIKTTKSILLGMTSRDLCLVLLLLPLYCNAVVHNTAKFKVWCGRKKSFTFFFSQQKKNELNQIPKPKRK